MLNVKKYLTDKIHQQNLVIVFIGLILTVMLLVLLDTLQQMQKLPIWASLSQSIVIPAFPIIEQKTSSTMPTPNENLSAQQWQDIKMLLASTTPRRYEALKKLGLAQGEYIIAAISIDCSECELTVLKINQLPNLNSNKMVAVAVAPKDVVEQWQAKLGLKYRVIPVSQELFEDLGAVMLPTLIKTVDGKAIGVSESAEVLERE